MHHTTSNGVTLCYQTDGDPKGEPLLLIMGLGMQMTAWPEQMIQQLVECGYYLIRFDNRDCGLSSRMGHYGKPNLPLAVVKSLLHLPLKSGYTLYDMAQDAADLLQQLEIPQAHVMGVSMGGMIAQILAAKHTEQVKSLTSIMSTSGRRGLPGPSKQARKVIMQPSKKNATQEQLIEQFINIFKVIGSPAYPSEPEHLRQRIASSMQRSFYPEGTARQLLAIAASGSRGHLLRKLQMPSLIIHGAQDPLVPLACGEDTAALIARAQLRVFQGMGHDLPLQIVPSLVQMVDAHCRGQRIPHAQVDAGQLHGQLHGQFQAA